MCTKTLPIYDPIVYCVHRFLCGHNELEKEVMNRKTDENKVKLEDTPEFKRSIFTRNMMQVCSLSMAFLSYNLGLYHNLFHSLALSYGICLIACLLVGHSIGMTLGLCIASCTRNSLIPKEPAQV